MILACSKCQELYERTPTNDTELCGRCSTLAELLAAADALNKRIEAELNRPSRLMVAVIQRAAFAPLVARAGRAIEKARSL